MKHFLANDWRDRQTQKRGGGQAIFSLDAERPEDRYRLEPADHDTPEVLFERRWALAVLGRVIERLRQKYAGGGKADLFEELEGFLSEKQATPHAELAARLGVGVSAVGVAIHRLRHRYAGLLREEIAHTLGRAEEVEDEIRHLIAVVGGS